MKYLIRNCITFIFCMDILFSMSGCSLKNDIEIEYSDSYTLEYIEKTDESGILIEGMKNDLPFNIEKVQYQNIQQIFHPQVKYEQPNYASNAIYSADKESANRNIYTPILFERDECYDLLYGGWDLIPENGLSPLYHGTPIDRLFMTTIQDKSLKTWENSESENRRVVLESDYINDPSLYHINDPTVIDLGEGHYRAYFEMESINKPSSFVKKGSTATLSDDKISKLEAPDDSEWGIPIHGIAMAESFNYGQTWQGYNSKKNGKVTRSDYIFIEGINIYSYAYWQIGWPSIIKLDNRYLMYFNMFSRADYTNREVPYTRTWKQYWNGESQTVSFNYEPNLGPTGNLIVCESKDGITFKYIGCVTNAMNRSGAFCYNPDVKAVDETTLLVTYNSDTFEYNTQGELEKIPNSAWGVGISYIKLEDPTIIYQLNNNSRDTMSLEALAFYPYLFAGDKRSSVTPQFLQDKKGNLLGIGYGEWQVASSTNAYIAAAYIQNYAIIKQNGKIIASMNLSKSLDETVIVTHTDWGLKSSSDVFISYHLNDLNPGKITEIEEATIEVFNIYGDLLLETKPFTLAIGNKYKLKKL